MILPLLTLFITNAFSISHLIKLFISFSGSVKIMKCTFIVENNGYCLKLKRKKERESQLAIFYFCLYLSQIFNDINDN